MAIILEVLRDILSYFLSIYFSIKISLLKRTCSFIETWLFWEAMLVEFYILFEGFLLDSFTHLFRNNTRTYV